jgi:hypothetical protein
VRANRTFPAVPLTPFSLPLFPLLFHHSLPLPSFYSKLDISRLVPLLMYWGYMILISYGFFCLTGTIGFFACHMFVRQIYGSVKVRHAGCEGKPAPRPAEAHDRLTPPLPLAASRSTETPAGVALLVLYALCS